MGKIRVRRDDGSTFELRTTKKTRHVRLAHERPVHVDLSELGETPALTELSLSYDTSLETLELGPLAGHPALESFRATVACPIDLAPLASCPKLQSLAFGIHGEELFDFTPLRGHATLARLALTYYGTQAHLDLSFVRDLPALKSLELAGGAWRTLDLAPLEGLALESLTLVDQHIASVDLSLIAQPALTHLMLQNLEIDEPYGHLGALKQCTELLLSDDYFSPATTTRSPHPNGRA